VADQFTLKVLIQAEPEQVYQTWINSQLHTLITGGNYQVDPVAGGRFNAWDGYISGSFIDLDPPRRIRMYWRASEFPEKSADSQLEILFEEKDNATQITLTHTEIPQGLGESYRQGWSDFYLNPLVKYYSKIMKTGKNYE
jgi:uncharacterized protein YndB with AHSA1/START domain